MSERKTVKDYMTDCSKLMVTTDLEMIAVMQAMLERESPVIVVTDARRELKGILTGSDVIRELEKDIESSVLREGAAQHVMSERAISVTEETLMIDAIDQMFRARLHYLIVTKGYQPIGILNQLGVIKWWLEEHAKG